MLFDWMHRIVPSAVLAAATPGGYSSSIPSFCGAGTATGGSSWLLPDTIPGGTTAAAALSLPGCFSLRSADFPLPHGSLGLQPAHTCSHRHHIAGGGWLREAERRLGTVRCGAEGCQTVRESVARFVVVTGGPVPPLARWKPTGSDGFATQNATARARHRA